MGSNADSEIDIRIRVQRALISVHDVTLKIKRELGIIKTLVEENGQLHTAVNMANETLSEMVQKMGINMEEIISESERNARLESNLDSITSAMVTEKLLEHMDL